MPPVDANWNGIVSMNRGACPIRAADDGVVDLRGEIGLGGRLQASAQAG